MRLQSYILLFSLSMVQWGWMGAGKLTVAEAAVVEGSFLCDHGYCSDGQLFLGVELVEDIGRYGALVTYQD